MKGGNLIKIKTKVFSVVTIINVACRIRTNNAELKAAYSLTMNTFRKKYFLYKSFVKVELSYVFIINVQYS